MNLLLDTHVWLWWASGDERPGSRVRSAIKAAESVAVSVASLWEIVVKHALGKLPLPGSVREFVEARRMADGFKRGSPAAPS